MGAWSSPTPILWKASGAVGGLTERVTLDQRSVDTNEAGDGFGAALTAMRDFGADTQRLFIGATSEAPGGDPASGVVFGFEQSYTGSGRHWPSTRTQLHQESVY